MSPLGPAPPTRRQAAAALLVVLLSAAVYGRVGSFGFVELDDPYYVYHNPALATVHGAAAARYAFTTTLGGNWHPLVWLSFLADRALWHLAPGPMHVENAAAHAASAVLVLLLLCDATGRLGRATACAVVFAVHPMHVESVAWISERKDVLSTAWLLAAACGFVRHARTGRWRWYAATLGCYGLSLSAKSMGVTLPGVLLLMDAWPLGRLRGRAWRCVAEQLPLLAMAAAVGVVTVLAQRGAGATGMLSATPAERLANAAVSALRYLAGLVWPRGLAIFYPFRPVGAPAGVAAAGLLALVTVAAVRLRRRRPYLLVGWLWFLGTLLPVIGIVPAGLQARADRYVYFPSVGLSIAAVWLAADLMATAATARLALAVAALAALAVAGWVQVGYWRDNLTLFTHCDAVTDDNYLALDELGREAIRRGDLPTAARDLTAAVAAAAGVPFPYADADLGQCALLANQPDVAVAAYARAVRAAPDVSNYHLRLAEAIAARDRAARRPPVAAP